MTSTQHQAPLFTRHQVIVLFLAAVALRLAYLGIVVALDGNINNGSDSGKFLQLAANINKFGSLVNWDLGVFGRDTGRMPLYPYLTAGHSRHCRGAAPVGRGVRAGLRRRGDGLRDRAAGRSDRPPLGTDPPRSWPASGPAW